MYGHWIATSIPPGLPFHVRGGRPRRSVTTSHAGVLAHASRGGATGEAPSVKLPLHAAVDDGRDRANVPRSSARDAAGGTTDAAATQDATIPTARRTVSRCIRPRAKWRHTAR